MSVTNKVDQRKYASIKEYWKGKSEELKNSGIVIKIKHERVFVRKILVNVLRQDGVFVAHGVPHTEKILITKAQRKFEGQTEEEHAKRLLPANPKYKDFNLVNNGGQTTVTLFKDGEQLGQGISKVNPIDNFIRIFGLGHALNRAIQDMNGVGSLVAKREDN